MEKLFSLDYEIPFRLWSASHLWSLAVTLAIWIALPVAMRRLRSGAEGEGARRLFRWALAAIMLLQHLSWFWWRIAGGAFDYRTDLPLQLCAVMNYVAIAMLLTRDRTVYEVMYFWALAGATQAVVTPDSAFAFPHYAFVQTMVHHGLIILAVLYMTVAERLRPTWRSMAKTIGLTLAYMALIFALNSAIGSNYLFINRRPEFESLVDLLIPIFGNWPGYVLGMVLIGLASFLAVYSPFAAADLVKSLRRRRGGARITS